MSFGRPARKTNLSPTRFEIVGNSRSKDCNSDDDHFQILFEYPETIVLLPIDHETDETFHCDPIFVVVKGLAVVECRISQQKWPYSSSVVSCHVVDCYCGLRWATTTAFSKVDRVHFPRPLSP
jgi:hypothetical protein